VRPAQRRGKGFSGPGARTFAGPGDGVSATRAQRRCHRRRPLRVISAAPIHDHDQPPGRFSPGGVCAQHGWRAYLSIYKEATDCLLHTKDVAACAREEGPVTCVSRLLITSPLWPGAVGARNDHQETRLRPVGVSERHRCPRPRQPSTEHLCARTREGRRRRWGTRCRV
jgi:hypothetical protein